MADTILKHWIEQTLLTACGWAEAREEGEAGIQAVINMVMNRVRAGLAPTVKEAILEPRQFAWTNPDDEQYAAVLQTIGGVWPEAWWTANDIACDALSGNLEDLTKGATHCITLPPTQKNGKGPGRQADLPKWARDGLRDGKVTVAIGRHTFFRFVQGGIHSDRESD